MLAASSGWTDVRAPECSTFSIPIKTIYELLRCQFIHLVCGIAMIEGHTGTRYHNPVNYAYCNVCEFHFWSRVLVSGAPCTPITTSATVFHWLSRSHRFYWSDYAVIFRQHDNSVTRIQTEKTNNADRELITDSTPRVGLLVTIRIICNYLRYVLLNEPLQRTD